AQAEKLARVEATLCSAMCPCCEDIRAAIRCPQDELQPGSNSGLELKFNPQRRGPQDEEAAEVCGANGCSNHATGMRKSYVPGWPDVPDCGIHPLRVMTGPRPQDEEAAEPTLHSWPDSDAARFLAHERAQRAGTARPEPADIERACEVMHDAYEAAAVGAGWETQQASRKPWADVPEANKATMRAAVAALIEHLAGNGSGRAEEHVEGAIKLGANPAEETEPIHMGWMSSFTPELQDAITAAANCPCSSYPCTCQRADQTQEGGH
ncbi:hypothetical protein, partial [Sporichthya brevicatena]|uniref:hypothetical protein n=1 Tax=Sporichthya brevicatena TaxID=171442 RepID=UPI0031E4206E